MNRDQIKGKSKQVKDHARPMWAGLSGDDFDRMAATAIYWWEKFRRKIQEKYGSARKKPNGR